MARLPFAGVPERDLRKWLAQYERAHADLISGKRDQVVLYRHDMQRSFPFTKATLGGLVQQHDRLRAALGLDDQKLPIPKPPPVRRYA